VAFDLIDSELHDERERLVVNISSMRKGKWTRMWMHDTRDSRAGTLEPRVICMNACYDHSMTKRIGRGW
jgi:hypothetical protein